MNKKVLTLCAGLVLAGSANVWAENYFTLTGTEATNYSIVDLTPGKYVFNQEDVIQKDNSSMVGNRDMFPTVSPWALSIANGGSPISELDNVNGTPDSRYFQFVVSGQTAAKGGGSELLTMVWVDNGAGQGHYEIQIENVGNANIPSNRIVLDRTLWKVTAEKDPAGTTLYYTLQNKATDAILQLSTSKVVRQGTTSSDVDVKEVALEVVAGQTDWRWAKGEKAAASEKSSFETDAPVLKDQLTAQYSNGTTLYLVKKTRIVRGQSTVSLGAILVNSTATFSSTGFSIIVSEDVNGTSTDVTYKYQPLTFEGWEANPIILTADQINSELGNDYYDDGESDGQFKFTFDPGVIGPDANEMVGRTFVAEEPKDGEMRRPGDAADYFVRFNEKGTSNYLMVDTTYYNEDIQDRYELKMAVREITFPRAAVQFGDKKTIEQIQAAEADESLYEQSNFVYYKYSAASYVQMKRQSNFRPIFYPATQTLKLQAEMIYKKAKNDTPWWYQVAEDITSGKVRIADFAQDNAKNQTVDNDGNTYIDAVGYYPAYFKETNGVTPEKSRILSYNNAYVKYVAGGTFENKYKEDGEALDTRYDLKWNAVPNLNVEDRTNGVDMLVDDPASITAPKAQIPSAYLTKAHNNLVKLVTLTTSHKVITTDILDKTDTDYNGLLTNISIEGLRLN